MLTLNLEQAQELIASVIKAHGEDKLYERPGGRGSCLYVHRDNDGNLTPGCIVGTAFMDYGIDPNAMTGIQDVTELARELRHKEILDADQDAVTYLYQVQFRQDDGYTWGQANESALEAIREGDDD